MSILSDIAGYAKTWNPVITWVLIIAGWWIVSNEQNKREARKEMRQRVDVLIAECNGIADQASAFYMKGGSDDGCEVMRASIVRDLSRLTSGISGLSAGNHDSKMLRAAINLRQVITLAEFDDKQRRAKQHSDQRLVEIRSAAQDLVVAVNAAFYKRYPSVTVLRD